MFRIEWLWGNRKKNEPKKKNLRLVRGTRSLVLFCKHNFGLHQFLELGSSSAKRVRVGCSACIAVPDCLANIFAKKQQLQSKARRGKLVKTRGGARLIFRNQMPMGQELPQILTGDDATIQQQSVIRPHTESDIIRAARMVILPTGAF